MDQTDTFDHSPFFRWIVNLLKKADMLCASDVHLEPRRLGSYQIRLRVGGQLQFLGEVPTEFLGKVALSLKLLSDLNITESRLPQDGQLPLILGPKARSARISCMPTSQGEKFVLRLSDPCKALKLCELNIPNVLLASYTQVLKERKGLVLVAGPTNSGKTTTIYGTLRYLNALNHNIYTVEDPIEHALEGVHQIGLRPEIGLNFSTVIRAILRQDPDILMLGEIRDQVSALAAIEASQAGHLVLATIHTNNIATLPSRFRGLGLRPGQFIPELTWLMAQRLLELPIPIQKKEPLLLNTPKNNRIAVYEGIALTQALKTRLLENTDPGYISHLLKGMNIDRLRDHAQRCLKAYGIPDMNAAWLSCFESPC